MATASYTTKGDVTVPDAGWRMEPLYPGYAFAAVRPDATGLALLRGNMHVIGLVLLNGAAVTVPDAVMARIGAAEAEMRTEAMPVERERPAGLVGHTVLVKHGLADIRAVVTAAIGRELRLDAAGMTLRVPVDRVERVA